MRIKIKDTEVEKVLNDEKEQLKVLREIREQEVVRQKAKRRAEAEERISNKRALRQKSMENIKVENKKLKTNLKEPLFKKIQY
jgi:hypothetical protein